MPFFYRNIKKSVAIILLFVTCHAVNASNLTLKLEGELPDEVKKNVLAHLGQLPTTELERSAFIYSVKDNSTKALQSLGYYKADIKTLIDKERWLLVLTITLHNATVVDNIDVNITGEARDDPAFIDFIKNNIIRPGDKLHHGKYESLKSNLLSLALQRGYFNGALVGSSITIKEDYTFATIKISYDSGPRYRFGEITFNNVELDFDLLSSLTPFQQGTFYTANDFHKLQLQLQSTQYFRDVHAVLGDKIQNKENNQFAIPVNVSLTPANSHQFDFGVGYATDTQFRLSVGWRTPLINSSGHFQETKFQYSVLNPTGNFVYNIPLSHPINDILQFKVTVENDDFADLTTKFNSIQVGRVVRKNQWVRKIYTRLHQEAWQYDLDETTPNIIWSDQDNVQYLIPGVTWSKTTRAGSALDPTEGFRQTYNIEGAHLAAGSDNSFFRLHGRWEYITTLVTMHRLVARAELGAIYIDRDAQLAPSLRFYAGGDKSIRGFAYQSIGAIIPSSSDPSTAEPVKVGGTRLAVASLEYQYYLNDKWRIALFTDGGSVTNRGKFKPVYSFGTGLHYLSPVGAVKFDFANGVDDNETRWRFHLSLGAEL